MIFYIHGLNSSHKSPKFDTLVSNFQPLNVKVIGLNYDSSNLKDAFSTLQNQINSNINKDNEKEPLMFIGTSLGAYLSLCLSNLYKEKGYITKAVLLNPAIDPNVTLQKYTTKLQKNYSTGLEYNITKENIKEFVDSTKKYNKPSDCLVSVQYDDDVIDPKETINKFGINRVVTLTGGGHRFENIQPLMNKITKYYFYHILD